jgi:two-component system LytT family response regulator/two-component system response regulator LytT
MSVMSTSTITAVIADDEQLARNELSYLLREFPELEVVGAGANGLEAVDLIERLEPEIAFLDVQMPGLDGLGVIRRLKERGVPLPHFVLATAYDNYAVEAFRLDAMDYILKPIDKDRLAETIERAKRTIQEKAKAAPPEQASQPRAGFQRQKILVKNAGRSYIVDAQDIIYATIDDGLITVVTTALEGESNYRTIEELQSNLDSETFWRVHRSYLVNINKIREVIPWFNSSYQLKMDDKKQTEIPVSRVQTKRLRALLKL